MDEWLTPDYCNRHYNLMPPEAIGHLLSSLEARSAQVRAQALVEVDVRYGTAAGETMDVFRPADRSRAILIFIHGGLWQFGDKSQFSFPAAACMAAGVTYIALNCSLVPTVTIEDQVAQCRRAAAFVHRHARELGADAEHIYVAGHSSGGHLAAMVMATNWPEFERDLPHRVIAGGLTLSGVHDLEAIRRTEFLNAALRLDRERVAALSPSRHEPVVGVRLYAAVGELENEEFQRQTRVLCDAWKPLLQRTLVLPGVDHFTILDQFADRRSALFSMVVEMMA